MNLKNEWKILTTTAKFKMMSLLVIGYSVVYGIMFGMIYGQPVLGMVAQAWGWLLIYGTLFYCIGSGAGILSVFYALMSFNVSRKIIFRIWAKSLIYNVLFVIFCFALLVPLNLLVIKGDTEYSIIRFIFQNFSSHAVDTGTFMGMSISAWHSFLTVFLGVMALNLFLSLIIAFFCIVGTRFGWEILLSTIFLSLALFIVTFVANINILIVTGYYMYHYIIGIFLADVLLFAAIYFLSQKMEVKN